MTKSIGPVCGHCVTFQALEGKFYTSLTRTRDKSFTNKSINKGKTPKNRTRRKDKRKD
jgi:hypothetical protein